MLTATMEVFSQQYGFSTITVTGLTLDSSRVRRKRTSLLKKSDDSNAEMPTALDLYAYRFCFWFQIADPLLDSRGNQMK